MKWLSFLLILCTLGCTEKWSGKEQQGIKKIAAQLTEKSTTSTELILSRMDHNVRMAGNRDKNVKMVEESTIVIDIILNYPDTASIADYLHEYWTSEISRKIDFLTNQPQNIKLLRSIAANDVANSYQMVVPIYMDTDFEAFHLWKSIDDPDLFKVGTDTELNWCGLRKINDRKFELIDPLLNKRILELKWQLIAENGMPFGLGLSL